MRVFKIKPPFSPSQLATSVLSRLDPTFQEPSVTSDLSLLPTYTQPKAIYTILPGLPSLISHLHLLSYPPPPQVDCTIFTLTSHVLQTHSLTRPVWYVVVSSGSLWSSSGLIMWLYCRDRSWRLIQKMAISECLSTSTVEWRPSLPSAHK